MSDVKYSLNGKYFKFFGVRVESSKGLLDKLKPRDRQSYVWAEYHGRQLDLSAPKYDARDIVLSCFVKGDNIETMTEQYNALLSEFDKSGTQRLLVEPFGYKPFVFDIVLTDKSELEKEFREGEMYGKFSISLQEPNPIKKILYTRQTQLTIAYNSSTDTDIIIDGERFVGKSVVTFSKALSLRNILTNNNYARNLFRDTINMSDSSYYCWGYNFTSQSIVKENGILKLTSTENVQGPLSLGIGINVFNIDFSLLKNQILTLSFKIKANKNKRHIPDVFSYKGIAEIINVESKNTASDDWVELSMTFRTNNVDYTDFYFYCFCNEGFSVGDTLWLKEPKIEQGGMATAYSPALEDQHYISIAGNIEDLTNFTTNAEVLWERI